ncbi:long-chain fatty acid-CoA ligase [Savitreella phatthalungensis]
MQAKFSFETDEPVPEGHGKIRRTTHAAGGLITQPHPEISTVYDIITYASKSFGEKPAMAYRKLIKEHHEKKEVTKKVNGKEEKVSKNWTFYEYAPYQHISFVQFEQLTRHIGAGLRTLGVDSSGKLMIFAGTCYQWMAMAHGAVSQSIPIVTAYDTLGEEGVHHSIKESGANAIFTDAQLLPQLLKGLKDTQVKRVIYRNDAKQADIENLKKAFDGIQVLSFDEIVERGKAKPTDIVAPKADDLACIMYTSGSTGPPKGVLLTHRNIVAAMAGVDKSLNGHISKEDYLIAFLPLAHIFEFVFENITLYWGGCLGYATVKTLTDANMRNCSGDLAEFRPTIMVGVPAVWEMVRKGIIQKIAAAPFITQKLFWGAYHAKGFMSRYYIPGKSVLDAVVFKKIKAATGGRLRLTLNGGGPLSRDTQIFMTTVLCPMLGGYGLTETCATSTVMAPEQYTPGSVGAPLACVELKLVDVPEAGYSTKSKPSQGEVWLRGDSITSGYLNRDDENKEAFEDGWFKTGDIGEWDNSGLLNLIDRKKNLVKTLNGEYIALEKLESQYRTCDVAQNVCVYASPDEAKPIALVVCNEAPLRRQLKTHGVDESQFSDIEELAKADEVRQVVLHEMHAVGKKANFRGIELISNVVLISEEFTPQNGLVTSAQKLQRKKIQQKYQDEISHAYKQAS